MNIFFLSYCIKQCAKYHCNKHVVKMILESAMLLYSSHYKHQINDKWMKTAPDGKPYRQTHMNHPCSLWVQECPANYKYLAGLSLQLCTEYEYRYARVHASLKHCTWLSQHIPSYPEELAFCPMTPPPLVMPDDVKIPGDAVESYRSLYIHHKQDLLQYSRREVPFWLKGVKEAVEVPLSKEVEKRLAEKEKQSQESKKTKRKTMDT